MADLAQNVCSVCGKPVPPGLEACPEDGNTLFMRAGEAPDSLVGMQLGEYVVKERVGEGGMSDVYAGLQPVIMKKVAIKVLKPEMAADKTQVQRLVTEAVAVNSIGHRNIIDIFSNGTLPDGRAYVVMEFLDGEGLDVYLQRAGVLGALEASELLIDICTPLSAAHAKGVIHRDLKPSNVFLVDQPDGTRFLKLLDFGLAKQSVSIDGKTSQTSVHQIAGTPDYMAPEQARGLEVSPLTDLYSLGVMAFQLLTGRLPFVAESAMDVMMMQVSTPPPKLSAFVPDVPPAMEQLVLQLMDKDPARRPPSAEVVRAELKHIGLSLRTVGAVAHRVWTGEVPAVVPATATPVPPRTRVPADDEPAPSRLKPALVGAGVLGLFAAVSLAWWSHRAPPAVAHVEPPPPVIVEPVPAPVEVEHPAAPPVVGEARPPDVGSKVERPEKDDEGTARAKVVKKKHPHDAPTVDELKRRLTSLHKRLRAVTPQGAEPDPSLLGFLKREELKLSMASNAEDRREIAKRLDAWEAKFLKGR